MAEVEEEVGGEAPSGTMIFAVDEGSEVSRETEQWRRMLIPVGAILEVCIQGSSLGVGAAAEEWFAVLVKEVAADPLEGWKIRGTFLGCESPYYSQDVKDGVRKGIIHLCPTDPCAFELEGPIIHASRVRLWRPHKFDANYLESGGKAALKRAIATEQKVAGAASGAAPPGRASTKKLTATPKAAGGGKGVGEVKKPKKAASGVIPVMSDGEEEQEPMADGEGGNPAQRVHLRGLLRQTRERILGAGTRIAPGGASSGGGAAAGLGPAAGGSGLSPGTSLNPRKTTPLALAPLEDTSEREPRQLRKPTTSGNSTSSALLAQAVQQGAIEEKQRKKRKKEKDKKDGVKQLLKLLRGDKKKKKKKRKRRQEDREGHRIKPEPDGGGDPDSSGYSSGSSTSGSAEEGEQSEVESDLSCEAPLRRQATKEPGSVMRMLVKHAQEQMDRGSLLESGSGASPITTGVKLSTYFALLIRPYHYANSPLLRELFALAQSIDLLRMGKLPETGDALASRFIAVHTALTDGNWLTASQLELFPLEPVQSTSTSTMLKAQKHRRLLLKSQGYSMGGRGWTGPSKGKGQGAYEKGKKGDNKGKGRGKGKNQSKEGWPSKGEANPWRENKEEPGKKA